MSYFDLAHSFVDVEAGDGTWLAELRPLPNEEGEMFSGTGGTKREARNAAMGKWLWVHQSLEGAEQHAYLMRYVTEITDMTTIPRAIGGLKD